MSAPVTHRDLPPEWSSVPQQTIVEILDEAARDDPERPAIIVEDGLVLTRAELLARSARFAGWLSGRIRAFDRVAVMLDNRVEFMMVLFAIVAHRAELVSIAPTAKDFDAGHILADSGAVLAVCGRAQQPLLEGLRGSHPTLREIVVVDGEEPAGLDAFDAAPLDFGALECRREDVITVYYTSGTTGAPKGCMLHHGWFLRVVDIDLRLFRRGWQDRQLCCLPFYYADPTIQLLTSLASRGTMIAMRRFSVSRFWDVVTRYDATEILSIASIPALLLKGERSPRERDHRIRQAVHAGVPKELHAEMEERFGFHWLNQYGSTELGIGGRVPLHLAEELIGSGSMGVEPPGIRIRLVDEDDNDVPVGEPGELVGQGADIYRGYLGRTEVSAEVNRGGWYHSGDLARRDERGLLYFVGRKKEIIRRSGENVSAAEVEAILRAHPAILEAAVIPVPDPLRGEEVKAYVQLDAGVARDELPPEAIVSWCGEHLAAFKVPRYVAYRDRDFERGPSMKVLKQSLVTEQEDLTRKCWDRETGEFRP